MPVRDDLILRTIEQLRQTLAWLLRGTTDVSALAEVQEQLEQAYRRHVGAGGEVVRRLASDQIIEVMSSTGRLDPERAFVVAALLEVDALVPGTEAELAAALRLRALDLYAEAAKQRLGEADLHERMQRLRAELEGFELPSGTFRRLLEAEVADGRFAAAEDLLFDWLEQEGPTTAVRQGGRDFYTDLSQREDAELAAGGLPRTEVLEGEQGFELRTAS